MKEDLTIWKPQGNVYDNLYVNSIEDAKEGLTIILEQENPNDSCIKIRFNSYFSYRNTNESFLLDKWHYYDRNLLSQSCLFVVENSDYISWIKKSALSIHDDLKVIHYAIFTDEDCLEILTNEEPSVKVIDRQSINE